MTENKFINKGKNIREILLNAEREYSLEPAFKYKNKNKEILTVTYEELVLNVEGLGTWLIDNNLHDTPIGVIGENSYHWFLAFLGITCSGIVAVPFDKGFTDEELASCIKRSKVNTVFSDKIHEELVKSSLKILEEEGVDVRDFNLLIIDEDDFLDKKVREGQELIKSGKNDFYDVEIDYNEMAVILFTSGTTSTSKAVMLSHKNIASNIYAMQHYEKFYHTDVNMAFLPFHHSFGLVGVLVFMATGAASVFCDGLKYVTKNLEEYGVTVFVGVPLIVENMYKKIITQIKKSGLEKKVNTGLIMSNALRKIGIDKRRKIFKPIIDKLGGKLRLIISGAAPLSPAVCKGFNDFGILLLQGYGLTETSPVLTAESDKYMCPGSVGRPMPNVKIQIRNEDENNIGEVWANGPNVMMGYLDQEEETNKAIVDQWFHTGDLGRIDEKGNLWLMGRKKNVIVMKNGKNVFPEEIEEKIGALPYVLESMIFTREKHNELVLWVKIVYKKEYLEDNIIDFDDFTKQVALDLKDINDSMPRYKWVNKFILDSEDMIKTTSQKVKRNQEVERINQNKESEISYTVE